MMSASRLVSERSTVAMSSRRDRIRVLSSGASPLGSSTNSDRLADSESAYIGASSDTSSREIEVSSSTSSGLSCSRLPICSAVPSLPVSLCTSLRARSICTSSLARFSGRRIRRDCSHTAFRIACLIHHTA